MKKPSMVLLHIGINWHGISSRTYIKIQPPLAFRSDLKILYPSMLNYMEGDDSYTLEWLNGIFNGMKTEIALTSSFRTEW